MDGGMKGFPPPFLPEIEIGVGGGAEGGRIDHFLAPLELAEHEKGSRPLL